MSGYAEEFNGLASAFAAAWNDRIPVAWPNVAFSPPQPQVPWCRFTILNARASRMTIGTPGGNRIVYPGRVVIQFFAPKNGGEIPARQYADEAEEIFRAINLAGYRFFVPEMTHVRSTATDDWYQINLDCPFQRDEYNG
ncbi:MAG: DUF4128 domain-containing protein [Synergistaceae bacterium]|jgi:hypothetical protein|nr:DUF4128 domain-containing protein [Synergistaceae bacterium]